MKNTVTHPPVSSACTIHRVPVTIKQLFGFVRKEFRHLFRDYRLLMIILGMPFAQVLIFGFAISTDIRHAPVAVLDWSHDVETERVCNALFASDYFCRAGTITDYNGIETVFRQGTAKLVVVFGADFARCMQTRQPLPVQLIADASDANTASLLTAYAQAVIATCTANAAQAAARTPVTVESTMLYNPAMKSTYLFIPGIICLLLMLISCIMTSVSITREKELGTMEVLLSSPLRPAQIILGKVAPYVALAFVIALVILTMGYTVFRLPLQGNPVLLLGECLLFITLALSIGIFISTVARTQQTAMMISMFAMFLPCMLLSGFIYPVENMPAPLQWLCAAMPPRWFIIIIKNIMLKGAGWAHVWKETAILAGMTVFFLTVSIFKFPKRLRE